MGNTAKQSFRQKKKEEEQQQQTLRQLRVKC